MANDGPNSIPDATLLQCIYICCGGGLVRWAVVNTSLSLSLPGGSSGGNGRWPLFPRMFMFSLFIYLICALCVHVLARPRNTEERIQRNFVCLIVCPCVCTILYHICFGSHVMGRVRHFRRIGMGWGVGGGAMLPEQRTENNSRTRIPFTSANTVKLQQYREQAAAPQAHANGAQLRASLVVCINIK